MLIFENGKPYPDTRYRGQEGLTIVPTETSFFLLAIIPSLTRKEIIEWKEGKLRYGIFISSGIPFLLLDFPGANMTLDAPFNSLKLDPEIAHRWAVENHDHTLLHLVLVEQRNYHIRAQRAIGAQPELIATLKETAAYQLQSGDSKRTIDERSAQITSNFTTADMIAAGKMYTL